MITPEIMDTILDQHSAIVGKTGSGKTYTAKGEVEYLLEHQRRACIIDPTGAWWGLRSSKSGKSAGFPVVVFGGDHADVPITKDSGARLAEIIAGGNFPSIVDLSGFNRTAGRTFMTAFLNTLYEKNRDALNLIIDEADLYAPQRPLADSKLMLHAMENIVSRGRIRGLRIMMITQRPAKLHKDCLTQVNSITMMKVMAPQDRNALKAWVTEQDEEARGNDIIASLPKLTVGSGWVWAPDEDFLKKVKFPSIKTFDSSRAPDADGNSTPIKFAAVDLSALAGMLEPKKLVSAKSAQATKVKVIDAEKIRAAAFAQGHAEGYQSGWQGATGAANKAIAEWAKTPLVLIPPKVARPKVPAVLPVSKVNGQAPEGLPLDDAGEMSLGPERLALTTLVQFYPAKLTDSQWATLTGRSRKSSTWQGYKTALKKAGRIEKHGNLFCASTCGIADLGQSPPRPKNVDEVIVMWKNAVGPASKVLDVLVQYYDAPVDRETLAELVGNSPSSSTFQGYLTKLNSNGLIEKTSEGIKASPNLFLVPGDSA